MIGSTKLNRIPVPTPAPEAGGSRIMRALLALDDLLSNQQKTRDAERMTYQQDVFLRSRELDAALAQRRP